jgi:hypothetical protein
MEKLLIWIAWRMPRKLVYWCSIRLMANATSGIYGNTIVCDLKAMEALNRWKLQNE